MLSGYSQALEYLHPNMTAQVFFLVPRFYIDIIFRNFTFEKFHNVWRFRILKQLRWILNPIYEFDDFAIGIGSIFLNMESAVV